MNFCIEFHIFYVSHLFLFEIASLHEDHAIHRDIALRNLLMDLSHFRVVVCDFGIFCFTIMFCKYFNFHYFILGHTMSKSQTLLYTICVRHFKNHSPLLIVLSFR